LFVVGLALLAVCYATEPLALLSDTVTHVIIPPGADHVTYFWQSDHKGFCYAEACYNHIKVYKKATNDIDPLVDNVYTQFSDETPILKFALPASTSGIYIAFYVDEANDQGPDGINGAVDFAIGRDEDAMNALIPNTFDGMIQIQIAMNSNLATLTWQADPNDATAIYRKDVLIKDFNRDTDFPPVGYYENGCSAKYFMTKDDDATSNVHISHPDQNYKGVTQIHQIREDTMTLVAITTEKKDEAVPFTGSYMFLTIGSASSAVLSVAALFFLLVSVLLI